MKVKLSFFLILLVAILLYGCSYKNTVISKNYNFHNMRKIGIVKFKTPRDVRGMEDLVYKYLLFNGFNVVDKNKMEAILAANQIDRKDYFNLSKINQTDNEDKIDVIFVGEVLYFKPGRDMVKMIETEDVSVDPGSKTVYTNKNSLGEKTIRVEETSTNISKEVTTTPVTYSSATEIGLIMKLIHVDTLDVVWVGSISENGTDSMDASENAVKYLVNKLQKDVKSMLKK